MLALIIAARCYMAVVERVPLLVAWVSALRGVVSEIDAA